MIRQKTPYPALQLRGTHRWHQWLDDFSEKTHMSKPELIERGLQYMARFHGVEAPPDRCVHYRY